MLCITITIEKPGCVKPYNLLTSPLYMLNVQQQTIAEEMEEWLMTEGSDGFTIQFPYLPEGLDDFVDRVVPELQRRGIFRREYEGKTLRDNLELPRPKNRFF